MSTWRKTFEHTLPCDCLVTVRWKSEQLMAVSHGSLSRIFRLDDMGVLIGEIHPNAWAGSVCPTGGAVLAGDVDG